MIEADPQDVSDGITPAQPKNTKTEKKSVLSIGKEYADMEVEEEGA